MFERNAYQKAMTAFNKADRELVRQRDRVTEVDKAIDDAKAKESQLTTRIDELDSEDGAFDGIQTALDQFIAERESFTKRVREYRGFRDRLMQKVAAAEIALFEAEKAVHESQGAHYIEAADVALKQAVNACVAPLRALQIAASGAAYHRKLGAGPSDAEARMAWKGVCPIFLLEETLRSQYEDELWGNVTIDTVPKGAPPVVAVRSENLSDMARTVAADLKGRNALVPTTFLDACHTASAPPVLSASASATLLQKTIDEHGELIVACRELTFRIEDLKKTARIIDDGGVIGTRREGRTSSESIARQIREAEELLEGKSRACAEVAARRRELEDANAKPRMPVAA